MINNCFKAIIAVILILSLCACTNSNEKVYIQTKDDYKEFFNNSQDLVVADDWTVYVLGEKTDIPVIIATNEYDEVFECVPLLPVLKLFCVEIIDETDGYKLKYKGKKLYIDFDREIVHQKGDEFNTLRLATGGRLYHKFVGNDVICCAPSLTGVCFFLDIDIAYHVDSDSKTIKIRWYEDVSREVEQQIKDNPTFYDEFTNS